MNWGELVPLALRKQLPLLSARLGLASKAGSANSRLHISTNDHNLTCVLIKKKREAIAVRVAEACGNAACAVCRACSAHLRASVDGGVCEGPDDAGAIADAANALLCGVRGDEACCDAATLRAGLAKRTCGADGLVV